MSLAPVIPVSVRSSSPLASSDHRPAFSVNVDNQMEKMKHQHQQQQHHHYDATIRNDIESSHHSHKRLSMPILLEQLYTLVGQLHSLDQSLHSHAQAEAQYRSSLPRGRESDEAEDEDEFFVKSLTHTVTKVRTDLDEFLLSRYRTSTPLYAHWRPLRRHRELVRTIARKTRDDLSRQLIGLKQIKTCLTAQLTKQVATLKHEVEQHKRVVTSPMRSSHGHELGSPSAPLRAPSSPSSVTSLTRTLPTLPRDVLQLHERCVAIHRDIQVVDLQLDATAEKIDQLERSEAMTGVDEEWSAAAKRKKKNEHATTTPTRAAITTATPVSASPYMLSPEPASSSSSSSSSSSRQLLEFTSPMSNISNISHSSSVSSSNFSSVSASSSSSSLASTPFHPHHHSHSHSHSPSRAHLLMFSPILPSSSMTSPSSSLVTVNSPQLDVSTRVLSPIAPQGEPSPIHGDAGDTPTEEPGSTIISASNSNNNGSSSNRSSVSSSVVDDGDHANQDESDPITPPLFASPDDQPIHEDAMHDSSQQESSSFSSPSSSSSAPSTDDSQHLDVSLQNLFDKIFLGSPSQKMLEASSKRSNDAHNVRHSDSRSNHVDESLDASISPSPFSILITPAEELHPPYNKSPLSTPIKVSPSPSSSSTSPIAHSASIEVDSPKTPPQQTLAHATGEYYLQRAKEIVAEMRSPVRSASKHASPRRSPKRTVNADVKSAASPIGVLTPSKSPASSPSRMNQPITPSALIHDSHAYTSSPPEPTSSSSYSHSPSSTPVRRAVVGHSSDSVSVSPMERRSLSTSASSLTPSPSTLSRHFAHLTPQQRADRSVTEELIKQLDIPFAGTAVQKSPPLSVLPKATTSSPLKTPTIGLGIKHLTPSKSGNDDDEEDEEDEFTLMVKTQESRLARREWMKRMAEENCDESKLYDPDEDECDAESDGDANDRPPIHADLTDTNVSQLPSGLSPPTSTTSPSQSRVRALRTRPSISTLLQCQQQKQQPRSPHMEMGAPTMKRFQIAKDDAINNNMANGTTDAESYSHSSSNKPDPSHGSVSSPSSSSVATAIGPTPPASAKKSGWCQTFHMGSNAQFHHLVTSLQSITNKSSGALPGSTSSSSSSSSSFQHLSASPPSLTDSPFTSPVKSSAVELMKRIQQLNAGSNNNPAVHRSSSSLPLMNPPITTPVAHLSSHNAMVVPKREWFDIDDSVSTYGDENEKEFDSPTRVPPLPASPVQYSLFTPINPLRPKATVSVGVKVDSISVNSNSASESSIRPQDPIPIPIRPIRHSTGVPTSARHRQSPPTSVDKQNGSVDIASMAKNILSSLPSATNMPKKSLTDRGKVARRLV